MNTDTYSRDRAGAALGAHRFLMRAAFSAVTAFAWIFAFQIYIVLHRDIQGAFVQVILLYAIAQVITALLTPYAARMLRHGVRRMLIWGTVSAAASLIVWGAAISGYFGVSLNIGIVGFAILLGIYRALYWVPYEVEREDLGKQPMRNVPLEFFIALMPAIAGYSLMNDPLGPVQLLFGTASVALVALLPLMHIRERGERFSWGYKETFGELIEPKHRPFVFRSLLDGMQGTALLLLWPIAIFMLVHGSYAMVGIVLSITLFLAVPLRSLGMRHLADRAPAVHAAVAASAWILRLVVATPLGIVIVDSYSSLGNPLRRSADAYALEQGADNGTYMDEFTALKEVSLSIGRLIMCGIAALAAVVSSLSIGLIAAFVAAGIAAALSAYLAQKQEQAI